MQMAASRIDEADPANPISVTNTEILNAVNEGQMLASLLTLFLVKIVSFPLTGACFYAPRTTLTDLIVPLRIQAMGKRLRPSTINELDAWNPAWQATPGASPTRYMTLGSNLLALTPQSGGMSQITYAYSPPPLASGDTPLLPPSYHAALTEFCVYRLRLKEGGVSLARGLGNLNKYLDAMQDLASWVRNRSEASHFDVQPIELKLLDRSKLVTKIINRQARQQVEVALK